MRCEVRSLVVVGVYTCAFASVSVAHTLAIKGLPICGLQHARVCLLQLYG